MTELPIAEWRRRWSHYATQNWPEELIDGCRVGDPATAWSDPNRTLPGKLADALFAWLRRRAS